MLQENKARDELQAILDGQEYQKYYNDKSMIEIWWENVKEWLADLLAKWFPSIEASGNTAGAIMVGIVVAVVIVLLIVLVLLFRNRQRARTFRNHQPIQSINEMNWSYKQHLEEATKQEELGIYALSTRHLFLALLLYFHDKGWLEAKVWKTNWEYYDELLKVNQHRASAFYDLALLFEEVTYGERDLNHEEYDQYKSKIEKWLKDETRAG
ncbi:DUF4129 domain-containing protein [Aquibacillus sp. 3ASR75-11]|uniref:DUF4129 domain-containing protein n=1 Tax=Terrihalobacillus insolitus TaxID=2950438 RepID=A0A9X3WXW5_9BACI|nr:DUF4129 domain-containing protein [Terrihalobacillus insolitus]MDC3414178.1 DUF4129 domain-containing protein [Terrihalobacillus insolitus]MDC3425384.1 DUF4129 domain-containing protein [Terrihalobacillus insolitus]